MKLSAGVDGAAGNRSAPQTRDRDRLAGNSRFVDRGAAQVDDAVDRNDLSGPHQQSVANGNIADRHLLDRAARVAMRNTRCPLDQASQILFGAPDRDILKQIAA